MIDANSITFRNICFGNYQKQYNEIYKAFLEQAKYDKRGRIKNKIAEGTLEKIEREAQKEAIKLSAIQTMKDYPYIEPNIIWNYIYTAHLFRKSGIRDIVVINKVISADQSWKKSSGTAFEDMIKQLGITQLHKDNIDIVLAKDLTEIINNKQLDNEERDIKWLKQQLNNSIFDLYAIVNVENKSYCYGCIQTKSSVRDRVTRDREPSVHAMENFFWSVIVVLDGDYLKVPKFKQMVNGGTQEFPKNGWHGLYVFTDTLNDNRIYPTNLELKNFKEHAIEAADYWLHQRQWFNRDWKAK